MFHFPSPSPRYRRFSFSLLSDAARFSEQASALLIEGLSPWVAARVFFTAWNYDSNVSVCSVLLQLVQPLIVSRLAEPARSMPEHVRRQGGSAPAAPHT